MKTILFCLAIGFCTINSKGQNIKIDTSKSIFHNNQYLPNFLPPEKNDTTKGVVCYLVADNFPGTEATSFTQEIGEAYRVVSYTYKDGYQIIDYFICYASSDGTKHYYSFPKEKVIMFVSDSAIVWPAKIHKY